MKTCWTILALILLAAACQQQPDSVPASAAEPITAAVEKIEEIAEAGIDKIEEAIEAVLDADEEE